MIKKTKIKLYLTNLDNLETTNNMSICIAYILKLINNKFVLYQRKYSMNIIEEPADRAQPIRQYNLPLPQINSERTTSASQLQVFN